MTETMLQAALCLAERGFRVFALNGKTPFKNCDYCAARRAGCDCTNHIRCHGFHAATQDEGKIRALWTARPDANIGIRPQPLHFVLDVDPRNAGSLPEGLPATLTAASGRRDGGQHLWFIGDRPRGLGPGIDVKDSSGYVVAPPSRHPDTGWAYTWENDLEIARWQPRAPAPGARGRLFTDLSVDQWQGRFQTIPGTWERVLGDAGWREMSPGDWLHPTATSQLSARVLDDLLYVFSTSTVFTASTGGAPRGYNRIEAYGMLNDINVQTPEGWIAAIIALEG